MRKKNEYCSLVRFRSFLPGERLVEKEHTMTFKQLAEKLGISVEDLFGSDEEMVTLWKDEELDYVQLTEDLISEGVLSDDLKRVLV